MLLKRRGLNRLRKLYDMLDVLTAIAESEGDWTEVHRAHASTPFLALFKRWSLLVKQLNTRFVSSLLGSNTQHAFGSQSLSREELCNVKYVRFLSSSDG